MFTSYSLYVWTRGNVKSGEPDELNKLTNIVWPEIRPLAGLEINVPWLYEVL